MPDTSGSHSYLIPAFAQSLLAQADDRSGQAALTRFDQIMAHWAEGGYRFQHNQFQADFLGIPFPHLRALRRNPEPDLNTDILQRIDYTTKIAVALSCLFNYQKIEAEWLERPRYKHPDLMNIVGDEPVADYLIGQGLPGFAHIHDYLETKVARVRANERYLLCLGICNTLIEVPTMYTDPFLDLLALSELEDSDPETVITQAKARVPSLACAIPLSKNIMLLKRPHLQTFIDFIKQQPNLDFAIVTGATKEYLNLVLGKAAPDLLSLCKFIWTRTDRQKFHRRSNGSDHKTLQHIPEQEGYRLGRILMLEQNMVYPLESHLSIVPFMMSPHHPEWQDEDDALLTAIQQLSTLLQADDIITLRSHPTKY